MEARMRFVWASRQKLFVKLVKGVRDHLKASVEFSREDLQRILISCVCGF